MTLDQVLSRSYLVGGAVRDELLGLAVHERDWVVVGCTEDEMLSAGFTRLDPEFPVFLHPETKEEYALARREKHSGEGYRGFQIDIQNVSLEEDLLRRDLTINAMLRDADGELIDKHDGVSDLNDGMLRHITSAFADDPIRLLRLARFAAQLGSRFRVSHKTHKLMRQMVSDRMMSQITHQRLGREIEKAFIGQHPWRFFEVLAGCAALAEWLPEFMGELSGEAHTKSRQSLALAALQKASERSDQSDIRFAVFVLTDQTDANKLLSVAELPKRLTELAHDLMCHLQGRDVNHFTVNNWVGLFEEVQLWLANDKSDKRWQVIELMIKDDALAHALRQAREAVIAINRDTLEDKSLSGKGLGDAIKQQKRDTIVRMLDKVIQHGSH
jgi:tRNA nucleotidyltransferase (CCA-adding enzyme)